MGDAFIYMYCVSLGTSLGVLTAAIIGFRYYMRFKRKQQQGGKQHGRNNAN